MGTEARCGRDAVIQGSEAWMKLYKAQDWTGLSKLYSPECKVFAPGQDVAIGRDGCAKVWKQCYKIGAARIVLDCVQTLEAQGGNSAADHSTYTMYNAKGEEIDHGKYVVVWQKLSDGKWYLHYDIFNTDVSKKKTLKEQIAERSSQWEFHNKQHNFKELSKLYTEDCKVFPPGQPVSEGRENCEKAWRALAHTGVDHIIIRNDEVVEMGPDMAADRSHYWMYDTQGKQIDNGKYVVVWKKVYGQWMLHFDIFNSNRE